MCSVGNASAIQGKVISTSIMLPLYMYVQRHLDVKDMMLIQS